jgi:hypothetical protein
MMTLESRRRLAPMLLLASIALGCDSSPEASDLGSETHFLTSCNATCADGFSCLCGVCTVTCREAADCTSESGAARCIASAPRVADGTCSQGEPSFCDVSCTKADDCRSLGASHRCLLGFCRAPEPPPARCQRADTTGQGAVVLGDALIELSTFVAQLNELAHGAGALAPNVGFRSYATSLNSFLGVDTFPISAQYELARSEAPVRMVLMNGGETDALQLTCGENPSSACPALIAAADGAARLFADMAAGGVRDVVYLYYAEPFEQPGIAAELSALRPLLRAACENAPLTCHFLDLRPTFEGHESQYYAPDGLVFNDAGAGAAAHAAFELVQRRCIDW